jgi:hypothetical protein
MTQADLRKYCLDLPEDRRAELAEALVDSLDDAARIEALRAHLQALEAKLMLKLRDQLEAQVTSWFDGEAAEMTEDRWNRLMERARTEDRADVPYGEAVPVEWSGRTPREHRRSQKES